MANKITNEQLNQMCNNAKSYGFRPERLLLLDQRLEEWSKSDMTPSIAVKILRHGQEIFEGAYGIKGPEHGEGSLTSDTIFPICSITKPVISTLLAIMQEEGLVDLNHPVRQYIPEFTGDTNNEVRIWHLLTHTSGIIDDDQDKNFGKYVKETLGLELPEDEAPDEIWDEAMLKIRDKMGSAKMEAGDRMRHDTFMKVCLSVAPTHKPQKVMQYCNTGYHLAKEIIDRLSGLPIDEYAGKKLFGPLKMSDSHFIFPKEKLSRYVTRGDEFVGSKWLNQHVLNSDSGPGGLKSTVHDMTRFGQMYLNQGKLGSEVILSPYSIREITSDHNQKLAAAVYEGETFDSTWGLGWNVRGRKKDDSGMIRSAGSYEHGGFGCCKLYCDPEADVVAAYFTVCKTDTYYKSSNFFNMVLGALVD
ncbi:MAG TPA: serine hydrolase domain-containing protein [Mobilitalea sp.]|nr:serine hydrolase domain-containing protein [Mobilitalea sp.]